MIRPEALIVPFNQQHIVNPTPYGEDPRKRAIRIHNIIHPNQILKTLESSPVVIQPEPNPKLTEESARFITKIARAVSNSKARAVGLLFPLIAGLPACGDNTGGESVTTTPTTIETPTTLPPTTIPTTEATTTTSTTVAETTTTSEAIDVSRATGKTFYDGYPLLYLGNIRKNDLNYELGWNSVLVRGSSIKTIINEDYQGRQEEELVLELIAGRNEDGSERKYNFLFAVPNTDFSIPIIRLLSNEIKGLLQYDLLLIEDPRYMKVLEEYVNNHQEFVVYIPYRLHTECETQDDCDALRETLETFGLNDQIISDLELLKATRGNTPYDELSNLSETDIGSVYQIILPPPPGGWEVWDIANS